MFSLSSPIIAASLFVAIIIANEVGLRLGDYFQSKSDDDLKSQTASIQGGIIGLLALILGFSFNIALNRYDSRAGAELEEANAIGTARLRTDLLPAPFDAEANKLLSEYIDLRLQINDTNLTQKEARADLQLRTKTVQERLWSLSIEAADRAPNPVRTGYFVQAINEVIDAHGKRDDLLARQIPPPIYYLLFLIFISTAGLIGYASGLGYKTSRVPALILGLLISLMVFIIVDLDRPRRGVIEVRQDSMEALRE